MSGKAKQLDKEMETVGVRISAPLKRELEAQAVKEGLKLSDIVRRKLRAK